MFDFQLSLGLLCGYFLWAITPFLIGVLILFFAKLKESYGAWPPFRCLGKVILAFLLTLKSIWSNFASIWSDKMQNR